MLGFRPRSLRQPQPSGVFHGRRPILRPRQQFVQQLALSVAAQLALRGALAHFALALLAHGSIL